MNHQTLEVTLVDYELAASLLQASVAGNDPQTRARAAALRKLTEAEGEPPELVVYRSAGRALVLGSEARALEAARALSTQLTCTVLVDTGGSRLGQSARTAQDAPPSDYDALTHVVDGIDVVHVPLARLNGHLGEFHALVTVAGDDADICELLSGKPGVFDLVLDLSEPPFRQAERLPPGYFAPGADAVALRRVLDEMPAMVGEFEKPKYFRYDPGICAHGRSGITGCTRCLDACPTLAITSVGERIEVNPNLCQGGGSCATACPTGAIQYVYPPPAYLLGTLRAALAAYREAGGSNACVLFYGADGAAALSAIAPRLPHSVLPIAVEEIGAVGMETWFGALAWGAGHVVLLAEPDTAPSMLRELRSQLSFARPVLEAMGFSQERLQLHLHDSDAALIDALGDLPAPSPIAAGSFAPFDEKRTNLRLAIDHLYAHAPQPRPMVSLPAGAPFGEVWLNQQSCTLCMACASQCPTRALVAGDDRPQLRFIEDNCVQCGLCARSCPENAIGPAPRYLFDADKRRVARVLYEEEPFNCIACGKPFASRKVMERMEQKLRGHWMFRDDAALRRIRMCEDCRVRDMFAHETARPGAGHGA
ncbi:MAG: 4Fe-4S binding protein [Pseudomonadota bacterium]|nr:MAG: 4Fe-4S binding protein [Pseudomonadota bacterium]